MPTRLSLLVVAVIAAVSLSEGACGGDDDSASSTTGDGGDAVAPSSANAFRGLRAALEAQGMTVASLPKDQLSGAESGVRITGAKSGTGLLFASQAKANDYSNSVSKSGSAKTTTVGTVVFTAKTQADADFFASAYEGG